MGESGAYQISRGLGFSPTLTKLSLAGNDLGDEGVDSLVDPFYYETMKIEHLNLANNGITDKGGQKLVKGFMSNKTLHVIDLRGNSLTD